MRVLRRGARVLDIGCWPGGWLQVASARIGPSGCLVGVDLAATEALAEAEGAAPVTLLEGDIGDPEIQRSVGEALGGPADLVLCDAAPKLTGIKASDRAAEEALLESVAQVLDAMLRPGGALVIKLFESPEGQRFAKSLRRRFSRADLHGLRATRKGSSERYLLGRTFRGKGGEGNLGQ